jgi:hypothetical protein
MSAAIRTILGAVGMVALVACSSETSTAPRSPEVLSAALSPHERETQIMTGERLVTTAEDTLAAIQGSARVLARALANDSLRNSLLTAFRRSTVKENKLHAQRYLDRAGTVIAREAELKSGLPTGSLSTVLSSLGNVEMYMPIKSQRESWGGSADVLVAGFIGDDTEMRTTNAPVAAYDVSGNEHVIRYDEVPPQPTIVLTRAEAVFGSDGESPLRMPSQHAAMICDPEFPPPEGCPEDPPPPPPSDPCDDTDNIGLWICEVRVFDLEGYEGVLMGNPEFAFRLHAIASNGVATQLGCANEDLGWPSYIDVNDDVPVWTGQARIGDRASIMANSNVVLEVWEDDAGSKCVFNRQNAVLNQVGNIIFWAGLVACIVWSDNEWNWKANLGVGACGAAAATGWLDNNVDDAMGELSLQGSGSPGVLTIRGRRNSNAGITDNATIKFHKGS